MGALAALLLGSVNTLVQLPALGAGTTAPGAAAPWRPPQWSAGTPPLTLTSTDPATGRQTAYVFDAIIRAEHDQQIVITLNPVQTGAAITDNAYVVPPTLVVEIRMSDSMQSYKIGDFSGGPSRSASAYHTLISLAKALNPVQVATRLNKYSNMMVKSVRAEEDSKTAHALKAIVTFQQILTAAQTEQTDTNLLATSPEIPQSTVQNATGEVLPSPVPASIQSLNNILSTAALTNILNVAPPL